MIFQTELTLPAYKRGFHLITQSIVKELPQLPQTGLLHILLKHTSAAITLNENADPTVRIDFENFMRKLVPENPTFYEHSDEGVDDMPAHIKSSLFGVSLTLPVTNHRLNLGSWQGIYLCEFRNYGGQRRLVLTLMGE